MNTPPVLPFNWALEDDDLADEPEARTSRLRLARLDNGTRPFLVHARDRCLN